jgi:pyruvate kinase
VFDFRRNREGFEQREDPSKQVASTAQDKDRGHHRPRVRRAAVLEQMIRAGTSVARPNLSHGTLDERAAGIDRLRAAAKSAGHPWSRHDDNRRDVRYQTV